MRHADRGAARCRASWRRASTGRRRRIGRASAARRSLVSEIASNAWSIEPRLTSVGARAREMWAYRRMFLFFARRAFEKLYRRTILGKAWIFLRPLVPLAVRVFVFGGLLQVGGQSGVPYFL